MRCGPVCKVRVLRPCKRAKPLPIFRILAFRGTVGAVNFRKICIRIEGRAADQACVPCPAQKRGGWVSTKA